MLNRSDEKADDAISAIKAEKADALVEWRHVERVFILLQSGSRLWQY